MEINVQVGKLEELKAEAVYCPVFEENKMEPDFAAFDKKTGGTLARVLSTGDYKEGQTTVVYLNGSVKRAILDWYGKRRYEAESVRRAIGRVINKANELGLKELTLVYPKALPVSQAEEPTISMVEAALLANYKMMEYMTTLDERQKSRLKRLNILVASRAVAQRTEKGVVRGRIAAEATTLARDLANYPSNYLTPTRYAEIAKNEGKKWEFKVQVLNKAEIEKLGMGALLGVARGSAEPPVFLILEHNADRPRLDTVVLVGKGVTFDTGGISLKPADKMEEMKQDMAGSATVLAAVGAAARLKLPVHLVGLMPVTENMPSGTATKPGDILKALNGKTIEVINTDAEGRLILADALTYAERYKPKAVVDIATLTGACRVALGDICAAVLGTDQRLVDRLKKASAQTFERLWQMPLYDEYDQLIKSQIADVKNSGGRYGGVISAARFLKKFIGDYPWAHIDIAGVELEEKGQPYVPRGATGFGARLLLQFVENWAKRG